MLRVGVNVVHLWLASAMAVNGVTELPNNGTKSFFVSFFVWNCSCSLQPCIAVVH